jgi:hypothetical protein
VLSCNTGGGGLHIPNAPYITNKNNRPLETVPSRAKAKKEKKKGNGGSQF